MASYMQPRSNLGGIARQPFRPGQWQGFKGVSRNTTYIQNNFYGSSVFGANRNYGYYTPQPSYHDCGNNDMPKWMKWMVGLGVGSSLLGGILKLFQKDKPEGGGEVQEPVQTSTPASVEAPTQAPAQEVTESPETPTGVKYDIEKEEGKEMDSYTVKYGDYPNAIIRDLYGVNEGSPEFKEIQKAVYEASGYQRNTNLRVGDKFSLPTVTVNGKTYAPNTNNTVTGGQVIDNGLQTGTLKSVVKVGDKYWIVYADGDKKGQRVENTTSFNSWDEANNYIESNLKEE